MKLCFCHKDGEKAGLYIIADNKGRACRLFANATRTRFSETIAETIRQVEIDESEKETILYPNSDIALSYGIEYAK